MRVYELYIKGELILVDTDKNKVATLAEKLFRLGCGGFKIKSKVIKSKEIPFREVWEYPQGEESERD